MPSSALSSQVNTDLVTIDANAILNALDMSVIVVDDQGCIISANTAAEQFFSMSLNAFLGAHLSKAVSHGHALEQLAIRALETGSRVSEHGIEVFSPRSQQSTVVDVSASPMPDVAGQVVLWLQERTVIQQMDRRLNYLGAARSVAGMASVLAHEVKNPLSGIRGAAQLLEDQLSDHDRELTTLICDEVDRICGLVDRMGAFSDDVPFDPQPVNIHVVLDRVQKIAENGVASHVSFKLNYDPSLPPIAGDRDMLIQVFLNLVKNAAEAVLDQKDGEIILTTSFKPGTSLSLSGEQAPKHLPLVVEVSDNGPGIPLSLQDNLFDPFVTSKPHGSGLGLALSAKIIGDHGGMIDYDTEPGRTVFRVLLPLFTEPFSTTHDEENT